MKNNVKKLREENSISQSKLGDMVGVSRQTINSLENERYNPSIELAFKLSRVFGIKIEEVFIYEENRNGKSKLIKIFKVENIILGVFITVIAASMWLFSESQMLKMMSLGLVFGVWVGVVLSNYIKIPQIYGKKDERELIITIISTLLGVSFAFVIAVLLFALAAIGNIEFTSLSYLLSLAGLLVFTVLVRFVSSKILSNVM